MDKQRIPKPQLTNIFDGGFDSSEDYFSKAEKENWAMPGHIDMSKIPGEARSKFPDPENIVIARQEFGDRIKEFIGDDTDDDSDNSDIWHDPWLEEFKEDREKFEAAGRYRGRMGETFVYTDHQFDEWEKEDYRQREFDKLFGADPSLLLEHDTQDDFYEQSIKEAIRCSKCEVWSEGLSSRMRGAKVHGERQLGSKRNTKEMRRFRKTVEEIADLDIAA